MEDLFLVSSNLKVSYVPRFARLEKRKLAIFSPWISLRKLTNQCMWRLSTPDSRITGKPESAGINRHVVGEEESLRERSKRLHPDLESCGRRREMSVEA